MKAEKKVFYKKLTAPVFPIAVQNLMTALVSASDALMPGFLDQTALSAVSPTTQVQFVLNLEQAHTYLQMMLYICSYYMMGKSINSTVVAGIFLRGRRHKVWIYMRCHNHVAYHYTAWGICRIYLTASSIDSLFPAEFGRTGKTACSLQALQTIQMGEKPDYKPTIRRNL